MKSITNGIFAANFFNTAILLVLVGANFKELGIPLDNVIKGHYSDFIPEWYTVVGYKLIQTMIINALFPLFEFSYSYAYIYFSRRKDVSWGGDSYHTNQTSMQIYIEMYSGPEYMIHFKYSGILNVCFVTFMYGFGMPVLFLIAAVNFLIMYI